MVDGGLNILHFIQAKPIVYLFLILIICSSILTLSLLGFLNYYLINIGNQQIENKKKLKIKKKHFLNLFVFVLMFLLLVSLYNFRMVIWKILTPVIWAIIFAYLLSPIVHTINKSGIPTIWSVVILYVSIIAGILFFCFIITPKITNETKKLVELLPRYTNKTNEYFDYLYMKVEQLDNFSPHLASVKETIKENLDKIEYYILHTIKGITRGIFAMFSHIVELVLIPIFTFYFLKDVDYFKKKIIFFIPKIFRNELINIFKDIHILLNKFIRGQFIIAACVGILSILALLIIKVNFALIIGIIAGLSNVIPYFGPVFGAIPAVVIALLDTPSKAFWVVIAFIVIQQIESAIITPKIVGESVGLHPITVIISLLIGNEWMGIIGLIFAVPIVASIKIVSKHIVELIVKP
ncbi:AI-2E family transporter [Marinisporobacter balticus]|uniref:Putative PurR-regulated permease PerM n=1 Tax=Marinisporobacter balticus TaxID=2018667 RepID=A0A4R2KWY6_9FIRM|nr:AI-2E family transporter [Marinisporobacter balticus]TCO79071.1 putative PurR-regulated permease PerM [Marinisporobacter balticus]